MAWRRLTSPKTIALRVRGRDGSALARRRSPLPADFRTAGSRTALSARWLGVLRRVTISEPSATEKHDEREEGQAEEPY
jgi:hypothetical protein